MKSNVHPSALIHQNAKIDKSSVIGPFCNIGPNVKIGKNCHLHSHVVIGGYTDNIPKNIKFHNIDCCDLDQVNKVMKGIDVVYHCAATAHEGLSVFSPYEIGKNNFLASVSIFSAAMTHKVKRIIFCS